LSGFFVPSDLRESSDGCILISTAPKRQPNAHANPHIWFGKQRETV